MAYTATTFAQLKTALAGRLGDGSKVFYTDTELGLYITEALRTFGLCAGFWRAKGSFTTLADVALYDINTVLKDVALEFILAPTVTDRDIIQQVQYALLESAITQTSWAGTEQFTYNAVVRAVQNRLNQFMSDTGIVVTAGSYAGPTDTSGQITLNENVVDVRRAVWLNLLGYRNVLWREDERSLTAASQNWNTPTADNPSSFSVMAAPPLKLQLANIPTANNGTVETLEVHTGPTLTPASAATVLGIPDDLTPAIKWGALADLLGQDGIAMDPVRAIYCEKRYQQYVSLARMLPVVVNAYTSQGPVIPINMQDLDSADPYWQNQSGTPAEVSLAASNLVALNPVPDETVYTITLGVVRKAVVPAADGDAIQVGQEQLDMILDYSEHLALFKVGGQEWHATDRAANNFLVQSLTYNQRISAAARYLFSETEQSQKEAQLRIRRNKGVVKGTGALVGDSENG